jgi:hypothetical protein
MGAGPDSEKAPGGKAWSMYRAMWAQKVKRIRDAAQLVARLIASVALDGVTLSLSPHCALCLNAQGNERDDPIPSLIRPEASGDPEGAQEEPR